MGCQAGKNKRWADLDKILGIQWVILKTQGATYSERGREQM